MQPSIPTFQFVAPGNQPNGGAGQAQYTQQGQAQISPGQPAVAASNPIKTGGMSDLANALKSLQSSPSPTQLPADVSQTALAAGAAMNPNSPSGENMGGVGPTQQNLALAQGLQNAVNMPNGGQPNDQFQQLLQQSGQPMQGMQNYQNGVSGGGWFGGGSGYGS